MNPEKRNIRVGIIGIGPVGMILAVKLQEAGCEVALCEVNESKSAKIRNEGLELENVIKAKAQFSNVFQTIPELQEWDCDYLIFALKSNHTASAVKQAECLITEKLTVVSAQNGIDVEHLLIAGFGENRTLRLVINFAGNTIAPNVTKVTFFTAPNYIGSVNDARMDKAKELAALLSSVQLETKAIDSFELIKRSWEKTILNASLSPLCGVSRLTMAEAMADKDTVELIEQIITEGIMVAEAEKIRFPDDFLRQCIRYLKKGGDHFPSLAVDLINNRLTEIDYFNGKIVEYGRKHYIRTSLNLAFTNMVKAMTNKNIISRIPGAAGEVNKKILDKGLLNKSNLASYKNSNCFLGLDLGSAYAKFTVVDEKGAPVFHYLLPTLNNDKQAFKNVMQAITSNFNIQYSCATGYGRKHFSEADIIKTEINCAASGVSLLHHGEKNIIDIGGEDIKVIRCDKDDNVQNFYMNDKCAAGTGSFLAEIAEKANINISEMSGMAELSAYEKELNSFCTVFAKTEIMNWVFEGMKIEDIARGIYISIANRVSKMRLETGIPTFMIGGVIAFHPYLKILLNEKFGKDIQIVEHPQFVVAMGAAITAMNAWKKQSSAQLAKSPNVSKNKKHMKGFHDKKKGFGITYDDIYLINGARTPFGKLCGTLAAISPTDLGIYATRAAILNSGIKAEDIDQLLYANIGQSSADSYFLPRHIGLYSGIPVGVPAVMLQRICGSGFETIIAGAEQISLGKAQSTLCGGTENMSLSPTAAFGNRMGYVLGKPGFVDMLWEALNDTAAVPMGCTAENVAQKHSITKQEADLFAKQSIDRYIAAKERGFFDDEIIKMNSTVFEGEGLNPRKVNLPRKTIDFNSDENVRPADLASMAKLPSVFARDGVQTAANSSGIVDGAASVVVASKKFVEANNSKPLSKIVSSATSALDPKVMGLGPVLSIKLLLELNGLSISDIGLFEINEAFAAQALGCIKELNIDPSICNVNGGAIALGHPLAASGTRLSLTLSREMKLRRVKYGIASACIGGGQGTAILFENINM